MFSTKSNRWYIGTAAERTASGAAFLPGDRYLETDTNGTYIFTGMEWKPAGGGVPGGTDTQVQFNDGGAFGGDTGLLYNKTAKRLEVGGVIRVDSGASPGFSTAGPAVEIAYDSDNTALGGTGLGIIHAFDGATLTYKDLAIYGRSLEFAADSNSILRASGSNIVFNNGEADIDLRIAGNGLTNGVYWDAGNGYLGIGTDTPDTLLHVLGGAVSVENTGASASMLWNRTDGGAMVAGGGSSQGAFVFDQAYTLDFRHDTRANVEGKVLNAGPLVMRLTGDGNIALFDSGSFGGGAEVVFIGNRVTAPTSNPSGGGILYAEGGALKWRGSSGTTTTIASA